MSADRELLELAAKAAGIDRGNYVERICDYYSPWDGADAFELKDGGYWNPLADDGDALRLAVRLRILAQIRDGVAYAEWHVSTGMMKMVHVSVTLSKGDEYAATRRAIVRAAAEIGRSMP